MTVDQDKINAAIAAAREKRRLEGIAAMHRIAQASK